MFDAIRTKLRLFRNRVRTCITVEGLCWLAALAVVLVFLSLGIDYYQRLGVAARVFSLLVGVGALAYLGYRVLLTKLVQPMDDERMALTVEDRFPVLADRLISSLQFAEPIRAGTTGRSDQSLAMMSAVTADAAEAAAPLDFSRVIDYRRLLRSGGAALVGLVALIAMSFVVVENVNLMARWFQRNILMMNLDWPRRTKLDVDYNKVVAKGDPLTITVRVSGTLIPDSVTIEYKFLTTGRKKEEELSRVGMYKEHRFEAKFKSVVEPLAFRISGGDNETDWLTVALVPRPSVRQLKFLAVYPTYTGRRARFIDASESYLEVLPGTTVWVAAGVSKPLRIGGEDPGALMLIGDEGEEAAPMARIEPRSKASDQRLGVLGLSAGDRRLAGRYWVAAGVVGDDGLCKELWLGKHRFDAATAAYIRLTDTQGFENDPHTKFTVRMEEDEPPVIDIADLRRHGIDKMITKNATIPLDITVTDDYGIESLCLKFDVLVQNKSTQVDEVPFNLAYGGKKLEHKLRWQVEKLGLVVGSVFVFHAEATDYKETAAKKTGRTKEIQLRVVTPDELIAHLMERQRSQSEDFERTRNRQLDEVQMPLADVQAALRKHGKLGEREQTKLLTAAQTLGQAAEEVRVVADQLEEVLFAMIHNKVGKEEDRTKLRLGIIQPCRKIAGVMIPELHQELKAAQTLDGAALKPKIAGLMAKNEAVVKAMDRVLANMIKMRSFRRIVDTARKIREDQKKLLTDIEREINDLFRSVLGDKKDAKKKD